MKKYNILFLLSLPPIYINASHAESSADRPFPRSYHIDFALYRDAPEEQDVEAKQNVVATTVLTQVCTHKSAIISKLQRGLLRLKETT